MEDRPQPPPPTYSQANASFSIPMDAIRSLPRTTVDSQLYQNQIMVATTNWRRQQEVKVARFELRLREQKKNIKTLTMVVVLVMLLCAILFSWQIREWIWGAKGAYVGLAKN